MSKNTLIVFMGFVLAAATTRSSAYGWGQYGHEQGNDAAITLLGTSDGLGECFNENRYLIRRMAVAPDIEWKVEMVLSMPPEDKSKRYDDDAYEHPLHYGEVDAWIPNPKPGEVSKLPSGEYPNVFPFYKKKLRENADYVSQIDPSKKLKDPTNPSVNEVTDHGTAPWRAQQMWRLGKDALSKGDVKAAMLYLGTMGHYVCDMSQPFHGTLNFDGQHYDSPAMGVHHEIDTGVLPQEGKDENKVYPSFSETEGPVLEAGKTYLGGSVSGIRDKNVVAEVYKMVDHSYQNLNFFLKQYAEECQLAQSSKMPADPYCKLKPPKKPGARPRVHQIPVAYERDLTEKVLPIVEDRLGECAAVLARLWRGAYEAAGKPKLSGCRDVQFDRSYIIHNYPRPNDKKVYGYLPVGYSPGHR
jgi:hypothetical protein